MPTLIRRYLGISGTSLPGITSMSTSVVAHVSGYMFLDKCEQLGLTKINRRGIRQLDGKKAIAWAKKYEEGLLAEKEQAKDLFARMKKQLVSFNVPTY